MWILKKTALILSPISFLSGYIESVLKAYFNNVRIVSTIGEALDFLKKNEKPDLIVGSYLLKDGDLFEFIEACHVQHIDIPPLLMVTSEENEEVIKRALHMGVLEVISKKVLKEKLRDFLNEFISSVDIRKLTGTLLCVEDSKVYSEFIRKALQETGMNFVNFDKAEEAYKYLNKEKVDIIVVDFLLKGDYSGLDLIRMIRKKDTNLRLLPIVVMTSFDDATRRLEIFKAGADDYILKPFSIEEFLIKIRNHIQKHNAIKALEEQLENLRNLYLRDPLTDAYNRNVLEFVEKEVFYSKRNFKPFSLVLFDFDNFKSVNDLYGHAVGDKVLVEFSKIVRSMIRKTDYLIRYGGEEFLLAMPGAALSSAVKKAEEIREAFEKIEFDGLNVTLSAGVACLPAQENASLEQLIEMADRAMYKAKKLGKNRVEVFYRNGNCEGNP